MRPRRLRYLPIFLALCVMLLNGSFAYTSAVMDNSEGEIQVSSANRLDITSGSIVGECAEYTITVPPRWAAFLIADRERQGEDSQFIEIINFYFEPTDKISKHVYLASICVQDSQTAGGVKGAVKIYETNMYVFWLIAASVNPLVSVTDSGIFQQFLKDLEDIDMIAGFISTPKDQWEIQYNTIKVNGKQIKAKSVVKDVMQVYLPLREVCEELGYKVVWYALDKTATVERERFMVVVADDKLSERQNYKAYLEGGKCYASIVFFIRNMALNVEIDENNNVFLSEWTG